MSVHDVKQFWSFVTLCMFGWSKIKPAVSWKKSVYGFHGVLILFFLQHRLFFFVLNQGEKALILSISRLVMFGAV